MTEMGDKPRDGQLEVPMVRVAATAFIFAATVHTNDRSPQHEFDSALTKFGPSPGLFPEDCLMVTVKGGVNRRGPNENVSDTYPVLNS